MLPKFILKLKIKSGLENCKKQKIEKTNYVNKRK